MSKHEKSKKNEPEAEGTAIAAASTSALPAHLAARVHADAGKGVSTASEDNIVPLIYVLQSGSPQVKKNNPDYIEGAGEGDLWLRNAPTPIVDGMKGIVVQPCYFYKSWVEWMPNRGGFVTQHPAGAERPAGAVEKPNPENPKKMQWVLPNGNTVVETRYHVVRVFLDDTTRAAYVIPMSSSAHTSSRTWMSMMNNKTVGQDKAPSYAALYTLKTKGKTKGEFSWATWDISDAGWVQSEDDYNAGAKLHEQFATGEKQAEADKHNGDDAKPEDGTM